MARAIDLMHRRFGRSEGKTCGECPNIREYSYGNHNKGAGMVLRFPGRHLAGLCRGGYLGGQKPDQTGQTRINSDKLGQTERNDLRCQRSAASSALTPKGLLI